MKAFAGLCALCALSGLASAWLPGEHRDIFSSDGKNLFNQTIPSSSSNGTEKRWLPASGKIRGVNLGSLFVFEPWIGESEWSSMGCGGQKSEFDCVMHLGQDAANSAFQGHWGRWITRDDILQMQSYGLNTIRIPVGYWLREDIVYRDSEYFPEGAFSYLAQICDWAADVGFYIIIDLHGAPGAQVPQNPFTGQVSESAFFLYCIVVADLLIQYAPTAGFYVDYQYERALEFLEWMTQNIHTNNAFRNVGMIEIVNEPLQNPDQVASMRTSYYPNAFKV